MLQKLENVVFSEKFRGRLPDGKTYVYPVTIYFQSNKNRQFTITGVSDYRLKIRELENLYAEVADAITKINKIDVYEEVIVKYKVGLETHDNYVTYHRSMSYAPSYTDKSSYGEQWEFIFPLDKTYDYSEMILDIGLSKGYLTKKPIEPAKTATTVVL